MNNAGRLALGMIIGMVVGVAFVQWTNDPVAEAVKYVNANGDCLRVMFNGDEQVCSFVDEHKDIRITTQQGAPQDMIDEQRAYERQQRFELWRQREEGKASF